MDKAAKGTGTVRALGLMSGTSLDGVDAAVIETDGHTLSASGPGRYRAYSTDEKAVLRAALGHWTGAKVAAAAAVVDAAHREVIAEFEGIELVGFHGQTVAHEPRGRGTLQVGDGASLTDVLGVPVVWDFRSDDVAQGGEGAPLAPFCHFACARKIAAQAPICFLNLGGVGNLTYVDTSFDQPEADGALLAFDTGPANAPINDLMQARLGAEMDRDGAVAARGTVDEGALKRFLAEPYFARTPPKSLDRNDFEAAAMLVDGLPDVDAVATLTAMSVAAVVRGIGLCPQPPTRLLVTGGGRLNPVMMAMLATALDCPVEPVEAVGLDGDMLEAQAFAYLAVRVARGLPTSCPGTTGVQRPVGGGRISNPTRAGSLV
ncbi:anhydro-N-acetylmuramic acid kinase [Sedimentitalea todarodis]|uniref:Anhydro-N-acetylmuramic acid kinase n=1 Tax=Sedimentitalea todarodis TaxID=1631240 RepID=A0ABU3VC99_9RHOB|nr:anhydro-N-acetylmuramic acid kinase [Sedimentitalea todarodis]MDU9003800.1 anhydro-N-acetylmuramic acid kinase [Sedimentitalea todarodis]